MYGVIISLLVKSIAFYSTYRNLEEPGDKKRQQVLVVSCTPGKNNPVSFHTKSLDCFQSSLLLLAALLIRPHNHPVLAMNLALYVIIMKALWPVMVEGKCGILKTPDKFTLTNEADIADNDLEQWEACARIILSYWFGQHCFFIMVSKLFCICVRTCFMFMFYIYPLCSSLCSSSHWSWCRILFE